jgi:hypothetical protein
MKAQSQRPISKAETSLPAGIGGWAIGEAGGLGPQAEKTKLRRW